MDLQKTLLWAALALVLILLWQEWQIHTRDQVDETAVEMEDGELERATPEARDGTVDDDGSVPRDLADEEETRTTPDVLDTEDTGAVITVETDTLSVDIDVVGGTLVRAELLKHMREVDGDEPVRILDRTDERHFILQNGLINARGQEREIPDHHSRFEFESERYTLEEGQDYLEVPLYWQGEDGTEVTKTYTFHRDSYLVDVDVTVVNASDADWTGQLYQQIQRNRAGRDAFLLYTYTGAVLSGYDVERGEDRRYDKIDFGDMADQDLQARLRGGWFAMLEHYFMASVIPNQEANNLAYTRSLGDGRFALGHVHPAMTVEAGGEGAFNYRMFVGPKEQERLREVVDSQGNPVDNLDRAVDYGIMWPISSPIFWVLDHIQNVVHNWGWSIIILTMLIKLVFYKLSATSYRSMAHMRRVAPRLKQIKEKYADDKQRMNQAMMDLYKKEKINPLGGCLPILVQIPVFIALYWVLLESVELRHTPWIGWIQDLSSPDPYFILPLIMGASMFVQIKLNPQPMDPLQQKIMMVMPFAMTFFFAFFPAGLVLYWTVNNILSIAQQWWITRKVVGPEEEKGSSA